MAMERWRPFSGGLRRWLPTRWPEEEMEDMLDRFERMFGVPAQRRAIVETRGWARAAKLSAGLVGASPTTAILSLAV